VDKIQAMARQVMELKSMKEERSFKDALFLQGELDKVVERVYGV